MWSSLQYGNTVNYNYSEYVCDEIADIKNLPVDDDSIGSCCVGSKAFVIENNGIYTLNHENEWVLTGYKDGSESGSGAGGNGCGCIHNCSCDELKKQLEEFKKNVYTKDEIDSMLENIGSFEPTGVTITIDCQGSDGSVPPAHSISIKKESGEVYTTVIFAGTPATFKAKKDELYIVVAPELSDYYAPIPVEFVADESKTITLVYPAFGNIETAYDIQKLVRNGKIKNYLEIDDQLGFDSEEYGELKFDVVDYDNNVSEDADKSLNLLLHDVLSGFEFCPVQALIACKNGLDAGTYNFTMPYEYGLWRKGTYQFTTTQPCPAGGQLKLSASSGNGNELTSLKFQMYSSPASKEIIETISIKTGTAGINLGNVGSLESVYDDVYINHVQRAAYGSNSYENSPIDQWLNATGTDWWVPNCMFDRPPSYVDKPGFFGQLPEDLRAVLGDVVLTICTNTEYESPDCGHEVNEVFTITRKVYLPSRMEIFGTSETELSDESETYESYENRTQNAERIKYDHNNKTTKRYWWLRNPNMKDSHHERNVNSSGAIDSYGVYNSLGVSPACSII